MPKQKQINPKKKSTPKKRNYKQAFGKNIKDEKSPFKKKYNPPNENINKIFQLLNIKNEENNEIIIKEEKL